MATRPTDLCVLSEPYLLDYQVRSLENAITEADVGIPLVIVNDPTDPAIDPDLKAKAANEEFGVETVRAFIDTLNRERAWSLVYAEKKIAEQFGSLSPSTTRVPVENVHCFADAEIRRIPPITDGNWTKLPPATIDLVEETCDAAVRFGFGLITGDILTAPEYGLLSFHPADIRRYRGLGTPQAWVDDRDVIGVTLQRLTEEIDGGEIIAYNETSVEGCATLWEAYETVYDLYPNLLVTGIQNLRDPSFEPTVPESLGPYYSVGSRRSISFTGRTLLKNLKGRTRKRVGPSQ